VRVLALRVAAIGLLGAPGLGGCAPARLQPIAFNHRLHSDNGVPCEVCHPAAATGQGAVLPRAATCRRCHENELYESGEQAKIRLASESGRDIAWVPIYALRPYVYFSHRRHVTLGKVPCRACHGDVETRTAPFQLARGPFSGRKGMAACIQCHRNSHSQYAGVDCVDCHR
jgi:hypothetical protein